MMRQIFIFMAVAIAVIAVDQYLKNIFLNGLRWQSDCVSLVLALNDGVAFSMLAFLKGYLKFFLLFLIVFALLYIGAGGFLKKYAFELALILGAGASNLYDRFVYGGVVDYVYWHCGFEFAIFNLADVVINIGVAILLYKNLIKK